MAQHGHGQGWLKVVLLAALGFAVLIGLMVLADWNRAPWYPF